jgi:D-glycero-beta-D-manno-heptose-7-phosphate kinase
VRLFLKVEPKTEKQRLAEIVSQFQHKRMLIVGDAIADRFLYGSISRVSREAPVFILRHEQTETVPGGAANCAVNLASLGADVSLISVVGNDEAGTELLRKLELANVDVSGITVVDGHQTTTKVRILAGQTHSSRQQVIRIDYEGRPLQDLHSTLAGHLTTALDGADAVVISDYNYGVVNDEITNLLRGQSKSLPILVDSRFRLADFGGFTAATPNQDEVEHLIGESFDSTERLSTIGADLRDRLSLDALLITRGAQGMMLLEGEGKSIVIPAVGAQQPVDVTGAGDTVIATFALSLACKSGFADAARLANYAGGLVVMKRGTASITAQELTFSILNSEVD